MRLGFYHAQQNTKIKELRDKISLQRLPSLRFLCTVRFHRLSSLSSPFNNSRHGAVIAHPPQPRVATFRLGEALASLFRQTPCFSELILCAAAPRLPSLYPLRHYCRCDPPASRPSRVWGKVQNPDVTDRLRVTGQVAYTATHRVDPARQTWPPHSEPHPIAWLPRCPAPRTSCHVYINRQ